MMLSLKDLRSTYNLKINGLVHCGARIGEELEQYEANGVSPVWWIEGNPNVIPKLIDKVGGHPGQVVIEALLTDKDHEPVMFHITNLDGLSSSILEFGTHKDFSPDMEFVEHVELEGRTLDSLVAQHKIEANFLVMDLQGAELICLRGAAKLLPSIHYIVTEVNTDEVYKGCVQLPELDEFLREFNRVETNLVGNQGWGDALYLRTGHS